MLRRRDCEALVQYSWTILKYFTWFVKMTWAICCSERLLFTLRASLDPASVGNKNHVAIVVSIRLVLFYSVFLCCLQGLDPEMVFIQVPGRTG